MIDVAWAQGAAGGAAPPAYVQLLPFVLLFGIFYLLILRPQQQKQKEHRVMLSNLKKNDQVVTSGGLYGRVMVITDDILTLEIAPNVQVRVARPQIASVNLAKPAATAATDKEKDKGK